jgi:hypothetical protein
MIVLQQVLNTIKMVELQMKNLMLAGADFLVEAHGVEKPLAQCRAQFHFGRQPGPPEGSDEPVQLVHRADDDPERFGVLAMHSAVLSLAFDVRAVQTGRGSGV